ncbi:hypothetical protein PAXRUDRAFT_20825 [Paxillus rubicundulus Ve08.2h10]|uniref:Uncharacterized protein n=1 Tax=Paxillus rubicundulus Ve08.2h10 TaxID=930991 RepID=A0A0D0D8Q3_9AGAM|nr:hypothetical protein PAXRUDRAFT_20825 [Paxillus rubicundulus Ve08.2h10]
MSSTRGQLNMFAVGFLVTRTGAEVFYCDREGGFREGYNPHVAAAGSSQPANVPPQPETTPENYAAYAVLLALHIP